MLKYVVKKLPGDMFPLVTTVITRKKNSYVCSILKEILQVNYLFI